MHDAFAALLRHPQLATHAFSAAPAWLWTPDGTRVLWANAAGAVQFQAPTPADLMRRSFDPRHPAARDIQRLRGTLPTSGAVQLARLRGFSSGVAGALTCACRRLALPDDTVGILVVATEPARPALPLTERARRMFGDAADGLVFSADGALLAAGAEAAARLAGRTTLGALHAGDLAARARAAGRAAGAPAAGRMVLERLGGGDAIVLLGTLREDAGAPARPTDETETPSAPADAAAARANAPAPPPSPTSAGLPRQAAPPAGDAASAGEAPSVPAAAALDDIEARLVGRRHPLRFVWRMDAESRFSIEAGDFTLIAGEPTAAWLGRPWAEIAEAMALDPAGQVARAIASRDTWSGITVDWPAEGAGVRLPVVLSGLPVLTRDRTFNGYRGFGVCRDVARIAAAIAARREAIARESAPPAPPEAPDAGLEPPAAERSAEPAAPAEAAPEASSREPSRRGPRDTQGAAPEATGPREAHAHLAVVPAAENVVPLRAGLAIDKRPSLSAVERNAFQEIARALGARFDSEEPPEADAEAPSDELPLPASADAADLLRATEELAHALRAQMAAGAGTAQGSGEEADRPASAPSFERAVLDRLPVAVLAYRGDDLLFANRAFFEWTGYAGLGALAAAGGLAALFKEPTPAAPSENPPRAVSLRAADGATLAVDVRLLALPADLGLMLVLTQRADGEREAGFESALRAAEAQARELKSILDTATDGVLVVDAQARILSSNLSAEALFGYESDELKGRSFLDLFAPESQREAIDYLEGLTRRGVAGLLNDGREVIGRVRQGGLIPLFMTMGRIAEEPPKFCAVFRDLTPWKRAEEELVAAKREAGKASSAKSDVLARISHELRTPLNTIIGFAELMMQERLGPVGNERYSAYLKDIHTCGTQLIALLDDLLDLAKIEAGRLDLTFTKVDLNDVMQQCVAAMQPQANRERIIIRTALSQAMPPVVADARSVRQIVLNLLANSIKFTGAGGQVIVSTALTDAGEAVMRVRDTGLGMSEKQIEQALEPFRHFEVDAPALPSGAGLGLPLTKALAEANRATFQIKSAVNAGTLVEIIFPANRVLAE
ncbi:MAG: PAS domain S-box protein [Variibacter sp.]|nr:PAS domain S-box protein [Variibacter sp.]